MSVDPPSIEAEFVAWKEQHPKRKDADSLLRDCFVSGAIAALKIEQGAMRESKARSDRRFLRLFIGAAAPAFVFSVARAWFPEVFPDSRIPAVVALIGGPITLVWGEVRDWYRSSRRNARAA
ncbi:MAG TPA: hypothetical protein VLT87_11270 [Thermoanaerobaculia bacterium]|nr:hypothetical protein [Thermoanaerobaculia bacterium]